MDSPYRQAVCFRLLGSSRRCLAGSRPILGFGRGVSEIARPRPGGFQPQPDCPPMGAATGYERGRRTELLDPEHLLPAGRRMSRRIAVVLSIRSGNRRPACSTGTAICGCHEGSRAVDGCTYIFRFVFVRIDAPQTRNAILRAGSLPTMAFPGPERALAAIVFAQSRR